MADPEARAWTPPRAPVTGSRAAAATSQPLATAAAMDMMRSGGNAVDGALAAAAVLCVTEPMSTGLGGDAFAIVHHDGRCHGLDAAGPAPAALDGAEISSLTGPETVTAPGAVAGWHALSERFGSLGLGDCLRPAITCAEEGFVVGKHTARLWREAPVVPSNWLPVPDAGEEVRAADLATTLQLIARQGPDGFYKGTVADSICRESHLEQSDLDGVSASWVTPLSCNYRGVEVLELPAPTQGVAALEALALLERVTPSLVNQVRAAGIALVDSAEHVRDGARVEHLLQPAALAERWQQARRPPRDPMGGTVYVAVVDEDRTAVSFIQSLFGGFGSGTLCGETGVVLSNRGACFRLSGAVEGGRRPFQTTIPGMLMRDGALWGPFGVVGGFLQAQAHVQLVSALVDDDADVQAALDRPRFRIEGPSLRLEPGLMPVAEPLREAGWEVQPGDSITTFGGGQAILAEGKALLAGSDARKDGVALAI